MEDQATQLRRLVEGKNVKLDIPEMQPVPPIDPLPSRQGAATESVPHFDQGMLPVPNIENPFIGNDDGKNITGNQLWGQEQSSVDSAVSVASVPAYSRGAARTIAITSGKGGVGKTSLAVNLAVAMGLEGQRVLIIDADLGMANVDILLGTSSQHTLMDLLKDDVRLEDVIIHGPYGVSYISGGSGMEHANELTEAQKRILFSKLAGCDEWADIILVDTGAGIGKNVLDFVLSADEVLLLTTPEPTAITDAYAMMKAYNQLSKRNNVKVIVNRVYDEDESKEVIGNLTHAAKKFLKMRVESIGYICDDRSMLQSVRKQTPLLSTKPNSVAAKCIKTVANNIINGKHDRIRLGWQGFLKKFFGFVR